MGCVSSKAVEVHASNRSLASSHGTNKAEDHPNFQIDVFDNTTNNNDLGGSSYNAKPRLRSAIRRGDEGQIHPIISNDTETRPTPSVEFLDDTIVSERQINRDSGFDSNRAHSEASRGETGENSGRLSYASYITMRSDSVTVESVVSARDLNASFMTVSDDYLPPANVDLTFDTDTPLEDLADSERTSSNTPSRSVSNTPSRSVFSVEPTPLGMHPKNIDVIKEESEGGFTPRSTLNPDDFLSPRLGHVLPKYGTNELPKYTADEVLYHNQQAGWCEWGIRKGLVYDTNKVISAFKPLHDELITLNENKKKEKLTAINYENVDDSDFDDDDYDSEDGIIIPPAFDVSYPKNIIHPTSSLGRAIKILVNDGIDKSTIDQNLPQCVIGEVEHKFSPHFWESFRKDVNAVLDDLIRADLKDELSQNAKDIQEQLQRWVLKFRDQNPEPPTLPPGDPNVAEFALPDGIQDHPECLRRWIEKWRQFDLKIPDSGAWPMYEVEDIDLSDWQEIFEATLRSHVDLTNPFISDVDGEAAWNVIPLHIFKDDVMTLEQQKTEESRQKRSDMNDTHRMEKRRGRLLKYFVKKYEMDKSHVEHFSKWAQAMEDGDRRFQLLCKTS